MDNIFELEQQTHLALAQYHRWYQVYEVPFTQERINNQKDILSDEVEISSQLGTTKGKEGLEDRLKVYTGWKNAHHVKHTEVELLPDGQLSLEADILYQNIPRITVNIVIHCIIQRNCNQGRMTCRFSLNWI